MRTLGLNESAGFAPKVLNLILRQHRRRCKSFRNVTADMALHINRNFLLDLGRSMDSRRNLYTLYSNTMHRYVLRFLEGARLAPRTDAYDASRMDAGE